MAVEVAGIVRTLPNDRASDAIGNQLMRAAASVAANIAEGYGRFSPGAFRNHLSIARGSLFETESWLDLLLRLGSISQGKHEDLMGEEINRLTIGFIRSLQDKGSNSIREEAGSY